MLDVNITMLFQMVNFFIALYVLNILLIAPIRKILSERRQKIAGLTEEANSFEENATKRIEAYEAELALARQEATSLRDVARNEGATKQHEILADAGKKAQALLADAQAQIRAEANATLVALKAQVSNLAGKLATRVMG